MPEKTVSWVSPIGSEPDLKGNYYLNVAFADETVGYKGAKAENIEKHWTALTELIGKPTEFQLEDKGFSSKGKPKFKIVSYGGVGDQRSYPDGDVKARTASAPPAHPDREEFIQERMDRRTALMQSVAIGSGITTELAEKFYRWLRAPLESVSGPQSPTGSGSTAGASVARHSADDAQGSPDTTSTPGLERSAHGEGASGSEGVEAGSEEVVQPRAASSDPPRKLGWDNPEEK